MRQITLINTLRRRVRLSTDTGETILPPGREVSQFGPAPEPPVEELVELPDGLRIPILVMDPPPPVVHLPDPAPGIFYLVSRHLAKALPGASDLVFPARCTWDTRTGQLLSSGALGRLRWPRCRR